MLGGAWESPDVYATIADFYDFKPDLAYFVFQRVLELEGQGKRSLTGQVMRYDLSAPQSPAWDEQDYRTLRDAAESYRKAMLDYEVARLQQGRHPDTDPTFWADYKEPAFPGYGMKRAGSGARPIVLYLGLGLLALLALVCGFLASRARQRAAFVVSVRQGQRADRPTKGA
jgi:hypothetical protein